MYIDPTVIRKNAQRDTQSVTRPDEHQKVLLQKLGLKLPEQLKVTDM